MINFIKRICRIKSKLKIEYEDVIYLELRIQYNNIQYHSEVKTSKDTHKSFTDLIHWYTQDIQRYYIFKGNRASWVFDRKLITSIIVQSIIRSERMKCKPS